MKRTKLDGSDMEIISGGMGDFGHFDDCAVCKLMKKAEEEGRQPTEKEMKKAFKEAEEERKKSLN